MTGQILDRVRAHYAQAQCVPDRRIEMIIIRHFIDAESCAALIARIDANLRPSTIAGDETDAAFRTSETCDLYPESDPFVAALDVRLADLVGVDPSYGEINQGQRYLAGQEFKLHTDYFDPGPQYDEHCTVGGQRTWTLMAYLNQPEAGGATRFKRLDRTIQPETGKLLMWNNRRPDGALNYDTLHQGMKVRVGRKYVMTKWFREQPYRQ